MKVLSTTCLCILLSELCGSPKPLQRMGTMGNSAGKFNWQPCTVSGVWVRSCSSPAGSQGSRSWGWGGLWARLGCVGSCLAAPGGRLALERPIWALEHPLPWIQAGLDPLPVPDLRGSVSYSVKHLNGARASLNGFNI